MAEVVAPHHISDFLNIVRSIDPGKDITGSGRGSEENVKIKLLLPLLRLLGYDVVRDVDFERNRTDIFVYSTNRDGAFIVETKSWEERNIANPAYLKQCLDYCLVLRTPYVLISSGDRTQLYSGLVNPKDLQKTQPLLEFSFSDLLGSKGNDSLADLSALIGKKSIDGGAKLLEERVLAQLPTGVTIQLAKRRFLSACDHRQPHQPAAPLDFEKYMALGKEGNQSEATLAGLKELWVQFERLERRNPGNVKMGRRSKEISLKFKDYSSPRRTFKGFVGVNPKKGKLISAIHTWKLPRRTSQEIESLKGVIKDVHHAKRVVKLVQLALAELVKEG